MVLTLGLVWGGTFLFQDLALRSTPPFWVAAARIGFAALLVYVVWQLRGGRMFTTNQTDWPRLFVLSVMSPTMPFLLLSWGQQYVTSAFAGISMATTSLFVLPMAHVLVPGERMTWRRTAGLAMGFAGVLLLVGPGVFSQSGDPMENAGRFACLAAAFCYATSSIMTRRLPPISPLGLAFSTFAVGAMLAFPLAWMVHGAPTDPGPTGFVILALLGLVPTAAANLLRIVTIRSAGPVFMSLTGYLVPLFAVLLGVVFLSDPVTGGLLGGLALILSGVGLSQYGALRQLFLRMRR